MFICLSNFSIENNQIWYTIHGTSTRQSIRLAIIFTYFKLAWLALLKWVKVRNKSKKLNFLRKFCCVRFNSECHEKCRFAYKQKRVTNICKINKT